MFRLASSPVRRWILSESGPSLVQLTTMYCDSATGIHCADFAAGPHWMGGRTEFVDLSLDLWTDAGHSAALVSS